jgi:hypothetical protein
MIANIFYIFFDFQSGRTGPLALKMDLELLGATEQYELSAFDVVSLYPWVSIF